MLWWLGSELVLLPVLDSGPLRRLVARRRLEALSTGPSDARPLDRGAFPASAKRYASMEEFCRNIEANYQGLTGISQAYLAEQRGKLDAILQGYLNRLMAVQRYERMPAGRDNADVEREIKGLERELDEPGLPERPAAALRKNLELKKRLLASLSEVDGTVKALVTELDSIESLLEVLYQNSISLRDPQAISADLDNIVRESENSERIVREVEAMMRSGMDGGPIDFMSEAPPVAPTSTAGPVRPRVKGR